MNQKITEAKRRFFQQYNALRSKGVNRRVAESRASEKVRNELGVKVRKK
jgi:hypothetical protein